MPTYSKSTRRKPFYSRRSSQSQLGTASTIQSRLRRPGGQGMFSVPTNDGYREMEPKPPGYDYYHLLPQPAGVGVQNLGGSMPGLARDDVFRGPFRPLNAGDFDTRIAPPSGFGLTRDMVDLQQQPQADKIEAHRRVMAQIRSGVPINRGALASYLTTNMPTSFPSGVSLSPTDWNAPAGPKVNAAQSLAGQNVSALQARIGTDYRSPAVQQALGSGRMTIDPYGGTYSRKTAGGQQYAAVPQSAPQAQGPFSNPVTAARNQYLGGAGSVGDYAQYGFDPNDFGRYAPAQRGKAVEFRGEGGVFGLAGPAHQVDTQTGQLLTPTGRAHGSPYESQYLRRDIASLGKLTGQAPGDTPQDIGGLYAQRKGLLETRAEQVGQQQATKDAARAEFRKQRGLSAMIDRAQRTRRGLARVPGLRNQLLQSQGMIPGGGGQGQASAGAPVKSLRERAVVQSGIQDMFDKEDSILGAGGVGLAPGMNSNETAQLIYGKLDQLQEPDFDEIVRYLQERKRLDPTFDEPIEPGAPSLLGMIMQAPPGRRGEFAGKAQELWKQHSASDRPTWPWPFSL